MSQTDLPEDNDQEDIKSKSEIKREMLALSDLGKKLVELPPKERQKIELSPALLEGIEIALRIKSNIAKKRQFQYIGKVLRKMPEQEVAVIAEAIEEFEGGHRKAGKKFQQMEELRDQLIETDSHFDKFLNDYPQADRQQLRTIIRNARKERDQNKPRASAKKLFKEIRYLVEASSRD